MKRVATIFAFLLLVLEAPAQLSFKTIVPQLPVVTGESFQVQYIVEDADKATSVKPPAFNNFRFVTGPNVYGGSISTADGIKPLKNSVYTLEAIRPGRFIIPGATITVNGKLIRSNDVVVEVISKEEAAKRSDKENGSNNSDYFLRPGENVYEKIKQNLFVKVMVDKKNCYTGEPVLATFKLYSRLESKSDIVKNPGFYGFTVYDMVNLADKEVVTENINGKTFDVHTIRKVQLYPLQAGVFIIDAMQVKNKVEFSRSAVNKKTEQEIAEGIFGNNDNETPAKGTEVFETDISTEPVTITVKPAPEKNKPVTFAGATGRFDIKAALASNTLAKNEQGFLDITIDGKGNFIQITAPAVQWPAGIEGFEPTVKDELDKTKSPLTGRRIFRYPFVGASPGSYKVLPVSFSFFNIDSNKYKTISTSTVEVSINNKEKKNLVVEEHKTSIAEKSEQSARIAGGIVVTLVLLILVYWIFIRKEPIVPELAKLEVTLPTVEELLAPANAVITEDSSQFYSVLHTVLWKFAAEKFDLSGSEMNKQTLAVRMKDKGFDSNLTNRLLYVLEQCEAGIYTTVSLEEEKQTILMEAKEMLNSISPLPDPINPSL